MTGLLNEFMQCTEVSCVLPWALCPSVLAGKAAFYRVLWALRKKEVPHMI